jgi:hypothetical protein
MNKNEQNRVVAWRLKLLRQASDMPGASPRPADTSAFLAKPFTNGEPDTRVTVRPAYATDRKSRTTFRRQRPVW